MTKTFKKYLDNFRKILLDEFMVYGRSFAKVQTTFSKVDNIGMQKSI
jgi:hypothetical protein